MRVDVSATRAPDTMPGARRLPDWALVVIASALAVALVAFMVRDPAHIDAVTISNPTEYRLTVDVRSGDGGGVIRMGTVGRDATTTFREVIDQGDQWVLVFSYGGDHAGEVEVDREALVAGWQIPPNLVDTLVADGLSPSPSVTDAPPSVTDG